MNRQPRSPEWRAAVSAKLKGRAKSPEARAHITAANRSPKRRAQVAEQMRGHQYRKGKPSKGFAGPHTAETRSKMSESQRARGERNRKERLGRGGRALRGKKQTAGHVEKRMKSTHRTMSFTKRLGGYWLQVIGKKGLASAWSKPRSSKQWEKFAAARAKLLAASAEFKALARARKWRAETADKLLVREYRAVAPEAKALIRRIIDALPRRRPNYTLEQIRTYIQQGKSPKWIADNVRHPAKKGEKAGKRRSVEWARSVKRLISELDSVPQNGS